MHAGGYAEDDDDDGGVEDETSQMSLSTSIFSAAAIIPAAGSIATFFATEPLQLAQVSPLMMAELLRLFAPNPFQPSFAQPAIRVTGSLLSGLGLAGQP